MMASIPGEITVSLNHLMSFKENVASPTGQDNPDMVRDSLLNYLKTHSKVTVDLANTKSMSPSFAYVAFGKLYDVFGEAVFRKIDFINDASDLRKRVDQALQRRAAVIQSENR